MLATYNVYENGGGTLIATGLTDLTPGTSDTFTVQAVNAAEESMQSATVTASTANIGSIALTAGSTNVLIGSNVTVNGVVFDVYGVSVPCTVVDMSSEEGH